MLKKIYNLFINIKNKFWINTTNHKDFYSNISSYILNLIRTVIDLLPKKTVIVIVILIWIILFITGNVTTNKLIRFGTILIVICIYRILHKEIYNIYLFLIKYINVTESFLLKIYRYKNPIILILIEIELVLFHIIRYTQVKNFKSKNINFIYHILYNISGLNGIKIILAKVYKVLLDWKKLGIYELLFKRIYGMVLSILVFTNIINLIIMYLNMITNNYLIWIYMFLVIIPYIYIILEYNINTITEIEFYRVNTNLIWNILEKKNKNKISELNLDSLIFITIEPQLINKNVKKCLGFIRVNEILTYNNFLIFLILCTNNTIQWWYSYLYIILQQELITSDYIYIKNTILKKVVKTENDIKILDYCEYQILLSQLRFYYIWDIEKELSISITNTLLYMNKKEFYYTDYTYNYNFDVFKKFYKNQIKNKKLNKFFDVYHKDNYNFYKEMYNYLYDIEFNETLVCQNLKELVFEEQSIMYTYDIYKIYEYYNNDDIKIKELSMQLENFKNDWVINQNNSIELKYYNLFSKIQNIKKKMINN